ncbi:hypothetical protein R4575_16690 [Acinetobacter baumannii]|nr:hypothetical protein [Acinetobacter baumannii]
MYWLFFLILGLSVEPNIFIEALAISAIVIFLVLGLRYVKAEHYIGVLIIVAIRCLVPELQAMLISPAGEPLSTLPISAETIITVFKVLDVIALILYSILLAGGVMAGQALMGNSIFDYLFRARNKKKGENKS